SEASAQQTIYNEGVLVAVEVSGAEPDSRFAVLYSPDGKALADGDRVYTGSARVTSLVPYKGGVFCTFATPTGSKVVYSPDGKRLNEGECVFDGPTVTAMAPWSTGLLLAVCSGTNSQGSRVIYCPDGRDFHSGKVVFEGSTVVALAPFRGGVAAS